MPELNIVQFVVKLWHQDIFVECIQQIGGHAGNSSLLISGEVWGRGEYCQGVAGLLCLVLGVDYGEKGDHAGADVGARGLVDVGVVMEAGMKQESFPFF